MGPGQVLNHACQFVLNVPFVHMYKHTEPYTVQGHMHKCRHAFMLTNTGLNFVVQEHSGYLKSEVGFM